MDVPRLENTPRSLRGHPTQHARVPRSEEGILAGTPEEISASRKFNL